jgi:hypothetical protein
VLVEEGKLARTTLPPWWDDFRDALVLVQEGKLACASFPPRWNDVLVQDGKLACLCLCLFEMHLCFCKMES